MAESLLRALSQIRGPMLDETTLVRAVGSGRRRGGEHPRWRRVELRYVDLKGGRHLQITTHDTTQAHTANHAVGEAAAKAVDDVLDEPFGSWHVETVTATHQLRVTKRLEGVVHTSAHPAPELDRPGSQRHEHDRKKPRLLPEDDPSLVATGISDHHGRVKPSRQAKYRQVEEFLRNLQALVDDALSSGRMSAPTAEKPWLMVDLGCGNAYLTFAAHSFLTRVRGLPVELLGIDVNPRLAERNGRLAADMGVAESVTFRPGDIGSAVLESPPDVVLCLHACDTATDDALARAVEWQAPLVLAAPCCHHDVAAQLRRSAAPAPYSLLTRHGILRERFADTLTDAVRAAVLRLHGYRVDVVQFVESRHTPRNTLLRAVRTGAAPSEQVRADLDDLTKAWGVRPRLVELLDAPLP